MSREQWGHGFHKGYEQGIKEGQQERYVCVIGPDGHLDHAYMIWGKHGDIYTVESLSDIVIEIITFGAEWSFSESEEDCYIEAVKEVLIDDLKSSIQVNFSGL